jgi:glutathione peroxidase
MGRLETRAAAFRPYGGSVIGGDDMSGRWRVGLLVLAGLIGPGAAGASTEAACAPVLKHSFPSLESGEVRPLCDFRGKVVLVVNTASECGYTPQYEGLEALYRKYRAKGLVILGFPANDFGGQEPGSNRDVANFCKLNYGVSFPMFEKTAVAGAKANPLYVDLARRTGSPPRWNFHKYVIDRTGNRVVSFASSVTPADARLVRQIEQFLAEAPAN